MSLQDILVVIDAITGPDLLSSLLTASIACAVILYWIWKLVVARYYSVCLSIAVLACIAFLASVKLSLLWLSVVSSIFLAVCLLALPINYYWCKQQLDDITSRADRAFPDCDFVAAFELMGLVNRNRLTKRQLAHLNEDRIFCNIYLGNNGIAKKMLEDECLEPAFRHFALHLIADAACDYANSKTELENALAAESDKTDPFIKIQLRHNRAIGYLVNGQLKVADDEFEKTYRAAKRWGIRNKSFLLLLFENAVLNKTRIGLPDGGVEEGWRLIKECERIFVPLSSHDSGQLFNLQILFMRQIGASIEEKNALYLAEVENIVSDELLTEQQRVVAMASLGRIAWSDGLNPGPVLDFFNTCDYFSCVSNPSARYFVHLNLKAMLADLAAGDHFPDALAESVARYFLDGDAGRDLDAWEKSLPSEAILERSQVLRERASLASMTGKDIECVVAYIDEAIELLEGGLQVLVALECRWQLARLAVYENPELSESQLSIVKERLDRLNKQPSLGYPYFELSLCYALLGLRAECRDAYEKATGFETPMGHYAPGVRADKTASAFCARFYMLSEVLGNPEIVLPLLKTEEGREWLHRYPVVSSQSKTILCGRFLGYEGDIPVMVRLFAGEDEKRYAEMWLVVQEIGLAFDLDARKPGEEFGLVFELQKHPLIANDAVLARAVGQQGRTVLGMEQGLCNEEALGFDGATAILDVLEALNILTEGRAPTLKDIRESYLESCVDIPASRWETDIDE